MIKGLTEEEKYKVIRPIFGEYIEDEYHLPVINKTATDNIDWNKIKPINFKSATANKNLSNKFLIMFAWDKYLMRLWNNPLKYVPRFSTAAFIATPDFSVYPTMNYNEIRHNVYKNRWLGKTWQNYGCNVIPTIQWWAPETYDICFGGVEKGSCVLVSTLGCKNNPDVFLNGFNEMKKRISPELIIVYGDMMEGMTGRFLHYGYSDVFLHKNQYIQLSLIDINPIFEIKEAI